MSKTMILDFSRDTVLDLTEAPHSGPYRECMRLGWLLTGPLLIPGSRMYSAAIVNLNDDTDFQTFLEITPEKAIARALEAARQERRAA
jgi:hypothetical protein